MGLIQRLFLSVVICVAILAWSGIKLSAAHNRCPHRHLTVTNSANNQVECQQCSTLPECPHGYGLSVKCDTTITKRTQIECVPCEPGKTFSSTNDQSQCQPCQSSTCSPNEIVQGLCTVEEDNTLCSGNCTSGYTMNPESKACELSRILSNKNDTSNPLNDSGQKDDQGYGPTGHQALFCSLIAGIVVLIITVAILICICCWKNRKSSNTGNTGISMCADEENIPNSSDASSTRDAPNENMPLMQIEGNPHSSHEAPAELSDQFATPQSLGSTPDHTSPSVEILTAPSDSEQVFEGQGDEQESHESPTSGSSDSHCNLVKFQVCDLNSERHTELCQILDEERLYGGDYRILAGKLGYTAKDVKTRFKRTGQPTDDILADWDAKSEANNVLKLIEILKDMGRDDALRILLGEINSLECQCGNCPDVSRLCSESPMLAHKCKTQIRK